MASLHVAPGTKVPKEDFVIIESMPVKSLITSPATGHQQSTRSLPVRGHAWAGDRAVAALHVSTDFGANWVEADLQAPPNPYSWQRWSTDVAFPERGYYEIWARATDDQGVAQPFAINWNPKGYLNNTMHRIAVTLAVRLPRLAQRRRPGKAVERRVDDRLEGGCQLSLGGCGGGREGPLNAAVDVVEAYREPHRPQAPCTD